MGTGEEKSEKKRLRILSGLQPSAGIQLGNYLGAIRPWISMQDEGECFFFIVDMHAITVPQDPKRLRENVLDGVAMYLACGLDPKKSHIYLQSQVLGHSELAWVLGCHCSIGQLERMTQFKDKSARRSGDFIGAGLLYYPVLMAADILLYDADRVPVGEDQRQHLELTRDLAERFNSANSPTFTVPEAHIPAACARVMSLQDPSSKMSKSDAHSLATVFLTDGDDQIRRKFRSAVTDSDSEIRATSEKLGIRNLLEILNGLTGTPIGKLEERYRGCGYGRFKDEVADAAIATLTPIRENFLKLRGEEDHLKAVLEEGRLAAQKIACETLAKVYRKIGFLELWHGNCHL